MVPKAFSTHDVTGALMLTINPELSSGFFCDIIIGKGVIPLKRLIIRGRNRQEARRKTLDFWFANRDQFDCSMKDFLRKCSTDPSGRVITYKE